MQHCNNIFTIVIDGSTLQCKQYSLCTVISEWLNAAQINRVYVGMNRSLSGRTDWIQRYIRTYLYLLFVINIIRDSPIFQIPNDRASYWYDYIYIYLVFPKSRKASLTNIDINQFQKVRSEKHWCRNNSRVWEILQLFHKNIREIWQHWLNQTETAVTVIPG